MELLKYFRDTPLENCYTPNRRFIAPVVGAALIAAGGSILSSLLGNASNNSANKSNERINERQLEESQKRLKEEQDYNNFLLTNQKQMQMSDAKSAGANPAFAQGSLLSGMSSSPSVSVPNQLPMHPYDWNGISQAGNNYLQALLTTAQVRKTNAETDLTEAQKDRQLIENEYLPNLMKSQVNLNTSNVKLIGENVHLTKKQADKVANEVLAINKQMQQIDATIAELNARIGVLNEDQKIKAAQATYQSDLMQATIKDLQGKYKLSVQQAQDIAATQVARIYNLQADTVLKGAQSQNYQADTSLKGVQAVYTEQQTVESSARTSNIAEDTNLKAVQKEQVYWNAQQNKLDFEIDKDFKKTERALNMAKTTAETANAAAQAAKNTVDAIKPW